jgi:fatty acid desaturase
MKVNWASFKTDRNFFLKYFSLHMILAWALFALLYWLRGPHLPALSLSPYFLLLLPIAFAAGVKLPVVLHNAVHENFKPRRLNEIIGELCGFFVLFGLAPFRISHILHHANADTAQDPHPPEGKSFFHFLTTTQLNSIRVIRRKYLDYHGSSFKTHSILVIEMLFYYLGIAGRFGVWLWLLGPTLMLAFYLPAWLTNLLVFAHINFATHVKVGEDRYELINLDHNWYYRTVNFLGDGAYYHKNHHRWPKLVNPSRVPSGYLRPNW